MYRVFINNKEVNTFDTIPEAYDFAISVEMGDTLESFNEDKDTVTFEGLSCIETTDSYNLID